jgi:hypothetical protein
MTKASAAEEAATKAEAEAPVIAVNGVEPDVSDPVGPVEDEIPNMSDLAGIRYVGMADVKVLTTNDLVAMGVAGGPPKGDLRWDASNGFIVQTGEFNAATRDVLLANKDFVAVS